MGWINWDRLTRVERENPWTEVPATVASSASSAVTHGGQGDYVKGKGKNRDKQQKCFNCGGVGHYANVCPKQTVGNWVQPVQPMLQNWPQQVAHQPQVVAPMMAITNGNTGGKGNHLAAQVSNVFSGKGGKLKAGGKCKGGHPKGF